MLCLEGAHATKKFAPSLSRVSSGKIHIPIRSLPPPHLPKKGVSKQRFYTISFIFIRPLLVHAGSYIRPRDYRCGGVRYTPSTLSYLQHFSANFVPINFLALLQWDGTLLDRMVFLLGRQGAYRYMDCTARESLGTNIFGSVRPIKTNALILYPKQVEIFF